MTGADALARLAIASLVLGTASCRRKAPEAAPLPESFARFELSAGAGAKDAGGAAGDGGAPAVRGGGPGRPDKFIQQVVPRELSDLMAAAHAHPAAASLEAAGCDRALVMTGAAYNRLVDLFVDLSPGTKMPKPIEDPARSVVYCSNGTTTPPGCAALAPIFARVAHPKRPFHVFSGFGPLPFAPRCAGVHDAKGKVLSGEGSGYAASR